MNIEKAKQLKVGQVVTCPADRGDKAYSGRVSFIQPELVNKNYQGHEYIWVTVTHPCGKSRHVWPSNRLGL